MKWQLPCSLPTFLSSRCSCRRNFHDKKASIACWQNEMYAYSAQRYFFLKKTVDILLTKENKLEWYFLVVWTPMISRSPLEEVSMAWILVFKDSKGRETKRKTCRYETTHQSPVITILFVLSRACLWSHMKTEKAHQPRSHWETRKKKEKDPISHRETYSRLASVKGSSFFFESSEG